MRICAWCPERSVQYPLSFIFFYFYFLISKENCPKMRVFRKFNCIRFPCNWIENSEYYSLISIVQSTSHAHNYFVHIYFESHEAKKKNKPKQIIFRSIEKIENLFTIQSQWSWTRAFCILNSNRTENWCCFFFLSIWIFNQYYR